MAAQGLRASYERGAGARLRRALAERERLWTVLFVAGALTLVLALAVWGVLLGGAERALAALDARWSRAIPAAERLFAEGRYEEAAARLERLAASSPAVFVKHKRDREHERVLELLGRSHAALGRGGRAVAALQRLVRFDPRNHANHFALAEVERELGDLGPAEQAYRAALAIHPTHLPSVQALVEMHDAQGLYDQVVLDFEAYHAAWAVARLALVLGGRAVEFEVPADGLEHELELAIEAAPAPRGAVILETRGWSVQIGPTSFVPPVRVGRPPSPERPGPSAAEGWTPRAAAQAGGGRFPAQGPSSRLEAEVELPDGCARARIALAVFKALPEPTWKLVEKAYRNRLAHVDELRQRTQVGGCLAAGTVVED